MEMKYTVSAGRYLDFLVLWKVRTESLKLTKLTSKKSHLNFRVQNRK